jgi:hypothetical protein
MAEETISLTLSVQDVRILHHAAATAAQVYDAAESEGQKVPAHAPLFGKRDRLVELARRLDHEANCAALSNPQGRL